MSRADRRARRLMERQAAKATRRSEPDPIPGYHPPTLEEMHEISHFQALAKEAQREATAQMLAAGRPATEIAHNALGFASVVPTKSAGAGKWHCKRGCSYCCHQQVTVTAPEAVAIAEVIRAAGSDAVEGTRTLVAQRATAAKASGSAEGYMQARLPCAFLDEDGTCLVYHVRPIMCRAYLSTNVDTCRDLYEQVEDQSKRAAMDMGALLTTTAVMHGMLKAATDERLDGRIYEMHSAVQRALEDPEAGPKWRNGDDPFAGCTLQLE